MSENQSVDLKQKPTETSPPVAARTRSSTSNPLGDPVRNKQEGLSKSVLNQQVQAYTIDELASILKKEESMRSDEEVMMLEEWSFLIPLAENRIKAKLSESILKQRSLEQEESIEIIEQKADILAQLITEANYVIVYTGAGISTSASIPDYRGPNGLWTQIRKTGTFSITKIHDLSSAEPTLTHMAIRELCRRRIVNHVVSQNCDGLHLRSGIPQSHLSEIHGDMYIEVCPTCEKQYFRQADITERTSRFRHKTGRKCHTCPEPNNNLIDTIVLYGERSRTKWPMNWDRAGKAAKRADLIICMGSSLKTLRRYHCLWPKTIHNSVNREPETKLAIINLQYTSKDKNAVLKINGKCDLVMQLVMQRLNINVPVYDSLKDPLRKLAIPFTADELAGLKRNLIFDPKLTQQSSSVSPSSGSMKRPATELSRSPSLFVSELTDDPDKKRLRMRIRAVNDDTTETSPNGSPTGQTDQVVAGDQDDEMSIKNEKIEMNDDKAAVVVSQRVIDYALPGWLGKSLGSCRTSTYRRKRHGNKGRKHSSVLKPQQSSDESSPIVVVVKDESSDQSTVPPATTITQLPPEPAKCL